MPPAPPTEQRSIGHIAFVSTRDGGHAIYLANEDGSAVTRLTGTSVNAYPAWSPDRSKIVFMAPDGSLLFFAPNDAGRKRVFVAAGGGSRRQVIPEAAAPASAGYEDCCAVWAR